MEAADVVPATPALAPPPPPQRHRKKRSLLRQIGPLVVLSFLQAASFGIMGPMLPIVMTEVRVLALSLAGGLRRGLIKRRASCCLAQYFARIYTQGASIDCGRSSHLPVRSFYWSHYSEVVAACSHMSELWLKACVYGSKEAAWLSRY